MSKLPLNIERAISTYGYANRHPEDADGIARAHRTLVDAIATALPGAPALSKEADDLENNFAKLLALTTLIYGNGHESFTCLHNHDQDNILWLVHDLASECRRLAGIVVWNEGGHHG